jgi:segregation and condensation protein A
MTEPETQPYFEPAEPEQASGYTPSAYRVAQDAYQGPLDRLLFMARDHEIDLFTVSLATIADEFLQYVVAMETPDLDEVGDYLVIAGQLLVLKSRALLPTETQEEEEEPVDEQALLLRRLRDYEKFKELADVLRKAEEERRQLYLRETPPPSVGRRDSIDYYEINVFDLATAFQRVMAEIGENVPGVIEGEEYTIDEKMAELQLLLHETGEMCLTLYMRGLSSRLEAIVTFLALLELMRLMRVRARQTQFFGDIWLYRVAALDRDDEGEYTLAVASDREGYVGSFIEEETDEDSLEEESSPEDLT